MTLLPGADAPPRRPTAYDGELDLAASGDRLLVRGTVDAVTAPLLHDDLTEALRACRGPELVVDLSAVAHLAAAGVRALVEATTPDGHRCRVVLVAPPGSRARRVLELLAVPSVAVH